MRFIVLPPGEAEAYVRSANPLVDVNLNPVPGVHAWNSDKLKHFDMPADSFALFPAGGEYRIRTVNFLPSFMIEYDHAYWDAMMDQEFKAITGPFDFLGYVFDPVAAALGRAGIELLNQAEVTREPVDMLTLEAIGLSVMGRVMKRYSDCGMANVQSKRTGGMNKFRLGRVQQYIEDRLADALTLHELAEVAGMSASNFARSFKQSVGQSPLRYVMLRRVERAKVMLAQTEMPIAEIAYACGFAGQAHLTRCFRETMGTTPAVFRRAA